MSTAVLEVINQLNVEEQDKIIDYAKNLINVRKENSLKKGYESFMSLREDAKINGTMGMSLDEINEEIRLAREEKRKRMGSLV